MFIFLILWAAWFLITLTIGFFHQRTDFWNAIFLGIMGPIGLVIVILSILNHLKYKYHGPSAGKIQRS